MTEETDLNALHKLETLVRERKDALTVRWLGATLVISVYSMTLGFTSSPLPDEKPLALSIGVYVVALVLSVVAVLLPKKGLTDESLRTQLREEVDVDEWAERMKLKSDQTRELGDLPLREQRLFGLTLTFERPYTAGLIVSGVLAILGFVYGLVMDSLIEAAPILLGALALNCWHYPRLGVVVDRGRRLLDREEEEEALNEMRTRRRPKRPSRPPAPAHAVAAPAASPPAGQVAPTGGPSGDTKQRLYEMLRERESKTRGRRQHSGPSGDQS